MKALLGVIDGQNSVMLSNGVIADIKHHLNLGTNVWVYWDFTKGQIKNIEPGTTAEEEFCGEPPDVEEDYDVDYEMLDGI